MNYIVKLIENKQGKQFVIDNHYSHGCPGGSFCFGMYNKGILIGVAVFGQVAGQTTAQKWYPENPGGLIELRRLVCIDDTEQNAESFFIGKCLRYLKNNTNYKMVISLADPTYNHTGIIYKASNFKLVGRTRARSDNYKLDGVVVHHRSLEDKYKTNMKGLKQIFGKRLVGFRSKGKYVYLYDIRTKRERRKGI